MNTQSFPLNKAKKYSFLLFQKVASLKFEDKIFLIIGAVFLINVLGFIYFAHTFFSTLQNPSTQTITQQKAALKEEEDAEAPFREFRENFEKLGKAFEENRRRNDEAFQKATENFRNNFEKAQEHFKKSSLKKKQP